MSIELRGVNPEDTTAISDISLLGAMICVGEGMSLAVAYTAGERCARHATEITFTALRQMGVIPEDFDGNTFIETAKNIVEKSGVTLDVPFVRHA